MQACHIPIICREAIKNTLNIDDGVKHNNSIDNVHEEEVKESESEHRFYYKLSTFK